MIIWVQFDVKNLAKFLFKLSGCKMARILVLLLLESAVRI